MFSVQWLMVDDGFVIFVDRDDDINEAVNM